MDLAWAESLENEVYRQLALCGLETGHTVDTEDAAVVPKADEGEDPRCWFETVLTAGRGGLAADKVRSGISYVVRQR